MRRREGQIPRIWPFQKRVRVRIPSKQEVNLKKAVRLVLCLWIPWVLLGAELQAAMTVGSSPGNPRACRDGGVAVAGAVRAEGGPRGFNGIGAVGPAGDVVGPAGAVGPTGEVVGPASTPARAGEHPTDDASNNPHTGITRVVLNAPAPGGEPPGRKTQTEEKSATPEKGRGDRGALVDEEDEEDEDDEDFDGFEEEFGQTMDAKISDPFEGYNRIMTSFNDGFYIYVFDPVARAYRFIIPEFGRRRIANFSQNLLFPVRFINNVLQAKFLNAGEELLRFCINSTLGIFGLWDPAKEWFGLEAHEEDFGQTLGYWGVGPGPHIVLPILGPSNLRDMFSIGPDYYLDPKRFIDPSRKELAVRVFDEVNDTSLHIGEYENLKKDAIDLYPFLRDVYEQNRRKKILE